MKPPIVILTLLFGAFALGDLASVGYINATNQRWPDLPGIILLGLAFSQLMLATVWFAFARWNIVVRLLGSFAIVFGVAFVAADATDGARHVTPWFAIQLIAFCSFSVPLWITRLLRWQINIEGQTRSAAGISSWQFSIWGLLSATTAAAIVLGTARQIDIPLIAFGEAVAFFGCLTLTGLLVFWVSMGIRSPTLAAVFTVPVVVIISPLAGMLTGKTGLPPEEHPAQWAAFGFCYGATIAVSVLALRIAGYRLERVAITSSAAEGTFGKDAFAKTGDTMRNASDERNPSVSLPMKGQDSNTSSAPPALRLADHRESDDR